MGGAPEIPGIDLGQEIGRGGGGRVLLGRHRTLDRAVAVKLIDTADNPEVVERFLAECRTAAALSGVEGVVPIHDAGTADAIAYIVMPYFAGGTLRDRLRTGPLPTEHVVNVVAGIGAGLAAAHDEGLIHRDVKPENILIGDNGRPALADFGVAALWQATAGLTAAKDFSGTVAYTAPERLAGLRASPKVDQFSLAVVAWEAITGTHPFMVPGAEMPQVIARILDPTPPDASALPEPVAGVLTRALSHDPTARYDAISEFVDALTDALGVAAAPFDVSASEPVLTVVPTAQTSRPRVRVAAAAAMAVLAISAGAWALSSGSPHSSGPIAAAATTVASGAATTADEGQSAALEGVETQQVRGSSTTEASEPSDSIDAATGQAGSAAAAPPVGGVGESTGPGLGGGSADDSTGPGAGDVTTPPAAPATQPTTTTTTTTAPTTTTTAATTTTTKATTTTTLPAPPGAPAGFSVSSPQVVSGACTTSPCQVSVSLSWSAASGTVDEYTVRATRFWFGSDCGGSATALSAPVTWTTTSRSLSVTTSNANAPCGWVRWEVWASNAGGYGSVAVATGVVPNVVGQAAGIGAAKIQTVGAYVGWETPDPGCGAAATICTQSVSAGTGVSNGSVVWLEQTE